MDEQTLLTDQAIQEFIVNGYTIVQADYPSDFHEGIRLKLDQMFETEGNLGNNVLPRIPEIGRVFDHPNVKGALTSLLGEDYVLNPHRHAHANPAGSKGQSWHKDCYVYDRNLRHPRFDWVLAFYYPQDTMEDMGPSAIIPGTQFDKTISSHVAAETTEPDLNICGPAGTVALIHFDAWHRASANTSSKTRYMLKFQFARMARREGPTWEHQSRLWTIGTEGSSPTVARDVWDWMCGASPSSNGGRVSTSQLETDYVSAETDTGVSSLLDKMRQDSLATHEETDAKTADNAHGTNPTPCTAALALSHAGERALAPVMSLMEDDEWWIRALAANHLYRSGVSTGNPIDALGLLANDEHWWVRRNALEALGEVDREGSAERMTAGLVDEDYRVRRSACIGIVKGTREAPHTVENLTAVLDDENRYNRFYAALALSRLQSNEATETLLNSLLISRWCPITTRDNTY